MEFVTIRNERLLMTNGKILHRGNIFKKIDSSENYAIIKPIGKGNHKEYYVKLSEIQNVYFVDGEYKVFTKYGYENISTMNAHTV